MPLSVVFCTREVRLSPRCWGANWYPRANVLFGINYTYLNHDNRADAAQTLTNVPSQGIDFHTVQMRAQFVF